MKDFDEDLIQRVQSGDVAAFEQIYKEYARFVYNVSLRIVRRLDDAQEVTQEVFLQIHRKLSSFRFDSTLKTWIYRITINTAINAGKKKSRQQGRIVEFDDQVTGPYAGNNIEESIQKEHHEQLISKLLAHLTPEQRVCIILRNMEGLSYQEIAVTLKTNINTVRSRLKRAREALLSLRKEVMDHEL